MRKWKENRRLWHSPRVTGAGLGGGGCSVTAQGGLGVQGDEGHPPVLLQVPGLVLCPVPLPPPVPYNDDGDGDQKAGEDDEGDQAHDGDGGHVQARLAVMLSRDNDTCDT